jgi:3-oxoacyl-[acyl-carrier-protein] synthase-1
VDGAPEQVIGHQASLFTRGFEGEARLVRLAQGALTDLLVQSRDVDWSQRRHSFYLSLPDADRLRTGTELVADDEARSKRIEEEAERQQEEPPSDPLANATRGRRILERAARLAKWPVDVSARFTSVTGHAAGLESIRAALADLASGATEVAVVLGVDSWLDEGTLQWLHLCGRLKCDGYPAGFQPGEAGVAIAIAQGTGPSAMTALARVHAVTVAGEERTLLSGASAAGEGLAKAIAQAWNRHDARVPWIISDQNGEIYRATDWGHAVVRLRGQFDAFADPIVWYPALSFGDIGAAGALAGVCIAARAWERRYAPAAGALIAAASDGEHRAALLLVNHGSQ